MAMSSIVGVEETTQIQKKLVGAAIGFVCMNIVDPPCGAGAWGKYNNRPLQKAGVKDLFDKFLDIGPLKCQADKVIFIPMRSTWYTTVPIPVINGQYIQDVPKLVLTPAGLKAIADGLFNPLNANHRREALILYCAALAALLAKLEEEVDGLEGDEAIAKQVEVDVMAERVEWAPYWTIQIHDIGALSRLAFTSQRSHCVVSIRQT